MSSAAKEIHPIPDRMPPASKLVELHGDYGTTDFIMRRGGHLPEVHIAYESWGELSETDDNAVLVFTGLSPSAHACSSTQDPTPGWWEYMIGPGKPIDTDRFFVVCVNSLGSCFGSTSPNSINPKTGKQYCSGFPELTIEDIAKAGHHAMQELGVEVVAAGCLVDRSAGKSKIGVPLVALAEYEVPAYEPDKLPPELAAIPAIKPGSRNI